PAYFSHVAEPASDAFTFRLLLREIGRRAFTAVSPVARVQNIRWSNGIMALDLDSASDFRRGDPVALVRPRANRASMVTGVDDTSITLGSSDNFPEGLRVALGNLPRYSSILAIHTNLLT